jgi:hypothetical protein
MSNAPRINTLHNKAMELASRAFVADIRADYASAEELFRQAFESERRAALLVLQERDAEPTRSVLLRSAASLAVDCREFREAERLVALGLSGNPPAEIAEELRDLLEKVYFSRHLSLRGLELDPVEFQMSLTGGAVGFGVAESDQFLRRAEALEKLLIRTVERVRGYPFREIGGPTKEALQGFEVYFSSPRAASFAITVRLGRPHRQLLLPITDFKGPSEVVDEFLTCVREFNGEEFDALRQRITQEAYFNNFSALIRKLAPDGEKVRTVGFTSRRGEEKREVALIRRPARIWPSAVDERRSVELLGRIRSADESRKQRDHPVFGVEDKDGKSRTVTVPPGMLQDIVKPYWGEFVRVVAVRRRKRLELVDIEPAQANE